MKLLERLFGKAPPPPPPTLAERIAALQTANADLIVNTSLGDDDARLRVGAIRLLPDGDALRVLAGLVAAPQGVVASTPPEVRQAAQGRLAQLIDEGSVDFGAFCSAQEQWPERVAVASLCKDPDRLRQLLARVEDPAELARLVVEAPSIRVRQSAAAAIDDATQLRELLPRVRAKDKTVYKLIKQKCDAFTAEQHKAEESAREAAALCDSLERHGEKSHDPQYAATLETLSARWRALPAHADQQLERRVEQALDRCRKVIAAHELEVTRLTAERAAEREAREASERALEAERRAAAQQAETDAQAMATAAAAREDEERARAEQRAAEAQAHRQIGSLIRLSGDALQRGNTRKAARFRQAIDDALQAAPAVPAYVTRNLQQLDDRLNELRQWKDYVVAPKRIELIEEMEALADSQEDPEALADHIRALQQEWRTINKGIVSDASAETERFQQAFRAAFKPCQEYFAAQAIVRRENLDARKRVLERLKAFAASQEGDQADFPLIRQVLREAPREWRSHSPVDREASRPAEIEFHQSMDRLRKCLASWYDRNETAKRSLIAQAQQLSTGEDTTQAIDVLKRLQALWKDTGPVSQDRAQALWDEFRAACDAIYRRRAEIYASYSAGLETAKLQAIALCEQVEQANRAATSEQLAASSRIHEWQAAFDEIAELPRSDARGLRNRFERALSLYEARLAEQDLRDAEAAESNLFEAARHIRAYERAVVQDASPADRDYLRKAAEDFMAGVRRWPDGGLQALKQALARADSASATADAACEQALRMLCIRSEIHASLPTPPEDTELRRDYQIRLLMERMGQAGHADDRDWDAMLLEWIGIGAIAPERHEALQNRFMRCLAQRPAQRPPSRAPTASRRRG